MPRSKIKAVDEVKDEELVKTAKTSTKKSTSRKKSADDVKVSDKSTTRKSASKSNAKSTKKITEKESENKIDLVDNDDLKKSTTSASKKTTAKKSTSTAAKKADVKASDEKKSASTTKKSTTAKKTTTTKKSSSEKATASSTAKKTTTRKKATTVKKDVDDVIDESVINVADEKNKDLEDSNKDIDKEATSPKKTTAKKSTTTTTKKTTTRKKTTAKEDVDDDDSKKETTTAKKTTAKKTTASTTAKKTTTKKATTSKKDVNDEDSKKETTSTKKTTAKKSTTTSSTTKKATVKKATTSTAKKATVRRKPKVNSDSKVAELEQDDASLLEDKFENIVEYYDLPYRYNQTVVKLLAQNPTTLFVYWDVSDEDIENFRKNYGDDFFERTKPVLVVHNLTHNYTFEIDINDFANNWYINVNDSKCSYSVELCRRFIEQPNNYDSQYIENLINVSYSNTIEIPNDHILFFKDNQKIYFKNIKTNRVIEKVYNSASHGENLKAIYSNYELSENEDRFDFKNPSSQNPTSNVM